jgi:hypothetical protein
MVDELITGKKNQRIEPKIMNFIQYTDTISPKAAENVSANLPGGPSKQWMQLLNKCERKSCLLESNKNDTKSRMLDAIKKSQIPGHGVSFSLSIDATKVPSELEIFHALCYHYGRSLSESLHQYQRLASRTD